MWYSLLCCLLLANGCASPTASFLFEISAPDSEVLNAVIEHPDFDLWSVRAPHIPYTTSIAVVAAHNTSIGEFLQLYPQAQVVHSRVLPLIGVHRNARREDPKFRDFEEVTAAMHVLQSTHPHLAKVYSLEESIEGRPILALKIGHHPNSDDPDRPEVIFVGCHHAREWISTEVVLRLAEFIVCAQTVDRIAALLASAELWFIPVLNPDGYDYTFQSLLTRFWRKNRRVNEDGTVGVDLNRNYDYLWGGRGSSTVPNSETYRGTRPHSEPEIQALQNFLGYRNESQFLFAPVTQDTIMAREGPVGALLSTLLARPVVTGWMNATTFLQWTIQIDTDGNYSVEVLQSCAGPGHETNYTLTLQTHDEQWTVKGITLRTYKGYAQYTPLSVVALHAGQVTIVMSVVDFGTDGVAGEIFGIRLVDRSKPLIRLDPQHVSKVVGLLSYHSYGQRIMWPCAGDWETPANAALLQSLAHKMGRLMHTVSGVKYTISQAVDFYPSAGEAVDWFWHSHDGTPSLNIELPPENSVIDGFVLSPNLIEGIAKENVPAALYFADYVVRNAGIPWLQQSFLGNIPIAPNPKGPLPWFPPCQPNRSGCLTTATLPCRPDEFLSNNGASASHPCSIVTALLAAHLLWACL